MAGRFPIPLTRPISINLLTIAVSAFIVSFDNAAFFKHVVSVYPLDWQNLPFLISLVTLVFLITVILSSLFSFRTTVKPLMITLLLASSLAGYFMDTYNIIIDDSMINNIVQTSMDESRDLLSYELIIYFVLLGVLPSILIYKSTLKPASFKQELISKTKLLAVCVISLAAIVVGFGAHYASFFREHKPLRMYSNPAYYIYSSIRYLDSLIPRDIQDHVTVGGDANIPESDVHRELVIFVVGETARADRFSLNGYKRKTNPLLEKEKVYSFNNFWACGTSTAVSVPCMFSPYNREQFDVQEAVNTDNLFDILQRSGVHTLWLDNNSDSKGVAVRSAYIDYKSSAVNTICDVECRDIGMLAKVQDYIDNHPEGDIFIVLHQMGNHGPAYYKRYPSEFEQFKPVCKSNQLEQCTQEELNNAYDNVILYTDFFLSEVIKLLKSNSNMFESALVYASDHGESLGEGGVYLHGLPYFIAPEEQKHVPLILWLSDSFDENEINKTKLTSSLNKHYTHDNLFHTLLYLFEVQTSIYDKRYSLL